MTLHPSISSGETALCQPLGPSPHLSKAELEEFCASSSRRIQPRPSAFFHLLLHQPFSTPGGSSDEAITSCPSLVHLESRIMIRCT